MKYLTKVIIGGLVVGASLGVVENAFASSMDSQVRVQDFTKNVTKRIPHVEQVCETRQVPIYGEQGFDQDGAIVGGIIGGVIGNQIGKGGGRAGATGVGAIIGSVIGGKGDKRIEGYQTVNQCFDKTTYTTETNEVYSYSVVEFYHEGRFYRVQFNKFTGQ